MPFRPDCSSLKTAVAPSTIVTRLGERRRAQPAPGRRAPSRSAATACAAVGADHARDLLDDLPLRPRAGVDDEAGDRDHDDQERRQREDRVVRERRAEAHRVVVAPTLQRAAEQLAERAHGSAAIADRAGACTSVAPGTCDPRPASRLSACGAVDGAAPGARLAAERLDELLEALQIALHPQAHGADARRRRSRSRPADRSRSAA